MLVLLMICMSGEESHKEKCLSDSLGQQNAATFVDCFRKGPGETPFLQVVLACYLILMITSADLVILLILKIYREVFYLRMMCFGIE